MKNKKFEIFEFIYKKLEAHFNSKNQNKNNLALFLFSSQNIFKLTSRLLRFECRFENLWVVLNKSHYPNFSWHFQEGQIAQLISIFNSRSKMFELFSVLTKHLLLFTQSFHSSVFSKNALHLCTWSVKCWIVQSSDPLCLFAFTQFLLVLYTICQNNTTTSQKFQLSPILFVQLWT